MLERDEAPHKAGSLLPSQYSRGADQRSRWESDPKAAKSGKGSWSQELNVEPQPETKTAVEDEDDPEDRSLDSYDDDIPPTKEESDPVRKHSRGKSYKTRGSISSQFRGDQVVIPGSSKLTNDIQANMRAKEEKERRLKVRVKKKVLPDVFIPSTVSVGQLARLLSVRISGCHSIFSSVDVIWYSRIGVVQNNYRRR